jgi:hypothetical protein
MGFQADSARHAAGAFLRVDDPYLSSIRRFAKAVGMSLSDLVNGKERPPITPGSARSEPIARSRPTKAPEKLKPKGKRGRAK